VVLFEEGKAIDKIIGFVGLADQMPEGREDEWKTPVLGHLLASKGVLKKELVQDDEAEKQLKLAQLEDLRKNITRSTLEQWDDLDFSLDDD
jgi:hypothetical protein